jgi:hypothetical protein
MEWHINDLSLRGQYATPLAFREFLEPILRLRQRRPDLRSRILCSSSLHLRLVTPSSTLRQAIFAIRDPTFRQLALQWFANAGPFWDESRTPAADDYFHFEGEDVTDQGLGEAARRRLIRISAHSFSFLDPPANRFQITPLRVGHGLPEDPIGRIDVPNHWSANDVEAAAAVRPSSWREMLEQSRTARDLLVFSDDIIDQLRPYPFHDGISGRINDLLGILQTLARETREDSSFTDEGLRLYQMHFVGEKASFTDESDANKRDFKTEMTFRNPIDPPEELFCPWHGKVKIGQYRIHFEWPRPKGQRRFKVVYIGPKITKR